ncbi:hypothetical protein L209DRAFT_103045 [Thermothelomyces heterothallicus CBS 203.75]
MRWLEPAVKDSRRMVIVMLSAPEHAGQEQANGQPHPGATQCPRKPTARWLASQGRVSPQKLVQRLPNMQSWHRIVLLLLPSSTRCNGSTRSTR